eukprot:TRINITY_DN2964_c0_g1_i3.p1 TRINITY_DN2964_c0_g1~~TRINITY_DN2964_c0_g1_i3.p1  ORF type:complete len:113 (+),score=13.77 TRINITY_DN2964_c0_g1_i3:191-529(+)
MLRGDSDPLRKEISHVVQDSVIAFDYSRSVQVWARCVYTSSAMARSSSLDQQAPTVEIRNITPWTGTKPHSTSSGAAITAGRVRCRDFHALKIGQRFASRGFCHKTAGLFST